MDLETIARLVTHPNVAAFLHVIRKGEAHDRDDDYTLINGGAHFNAPPWVHPFEGIPTTHGGKASGAGGFLGTTWANLRKQHPDLLPDFSPPCQDLGMVLLIIGRDGMDALIAGDFDTAVWRCRAEWTSLPGAAENNPRWNLDAARAHYLAHGGQLVPAAVPESPPASATAPVAMPVPPTQGNRAMDPLSIIGLVGTVLQTLLPQVGTLLGGKKDQQNAQLIGTVLNTVSQAAGTVAAGETATLASTASAIEKMQADPATVKVVKDAVITHPDIAPLLVLTEVGGGIVAAREEAQKAVAVESWWRPLVTPAFIISHWLLGIAICVLVDILWVHPTSWSGSDRSQVLIICITIISGVMGFYIGSSVSSAKKDETIAKVALAP